MRRALGAATLALALSACASPSAQLQDAVADLTDAANSRDADGTVREAEDLLTLIEQQRGEELEDARADRMRQYALAVRDGAEALESLEPTPSPTPSPTPEPEPEQEEPEPEPEETQEEEPEPTPEPEEPEETEEPEPRESEGDGGILPLPTGESTQDTAQPASPTSASPVAASSPRQTARPSRTPSRTPTPGATTAVAVRSGQSTSPAPTSTAARSAAPSRA